MIGPCLSQKGWASQKSAELGQRFPKEAGALGARSLGTQGRRRLSQPSERVDGRWNGPRREQWAVPPDPSAPPF